MGSWHAPLGLQIYYFIISENADHIDYLCGEGGEGGVLKRRVREQNGLVITTHIYNLFRVSLFHSDETFMCMHAQEVFFFSNKIHKKPVTFFKNGHKKLFSLQNVMKKIV